MNYDIPRLWSDLINEGDVEGVLALYAENAPLFATFDPQPLDRPEQRRKYFEGFLGRPGAGVELDEASLGFVSTAEGAYHATGLYTFFYEENGILVRQAARFTFIVSVDQGPAILHHHSSLVPNPKPE